ncbi:MAG: DUF4331 family protein [Acidobacteriota bacterium]
MLRLSSRNRRFSAFTLALSLFLALVVIPVQQIGAADHGDAPALGADRSADINDVYVFLDPTDNTKVVFLFTFNGFIVPGEAVNFGVFDHNLRYRFEIEANGDPIPDGFIDVTFSEKINSGATPQTATVSSTFFSTFTAPSTPAALSPTAPTPVVTNDAPSGIAFYAGLPDDPFFFDIPAFSRFTASVLAGTPDPAAFNRGRDSFAGYNTLAIGLSIPAQLLRNRLNVANNTLGVGVRTQRRTSSVIRRPVRGAQESSPFIDIDRMGNPAINVALIPYPRKNEYNLGTTQDDAAGRYASSIVGTLMALGTNTTNIGILAQVAVARGDFLRIDLTKANTGPGAGTNAGAGFPNGRRLADDVIDTILFFVANQNVLGDSVNANDVPFRDTFPFFGLSQQPRASGDDNTKN